MTEVIGLGLILVGSALVYLGTTDWQGKGIPGMMDTLIQRLTPTNG